jgi:hypothetical protein
VVPQCRRSARVGPPCSVDARALSANRTWSHEIATHAIDAARAALPAAKYHQNTSAAHGVESDSAVDAQWDVFHRLMRVECFGGQSRITPEVWARLKVTHPELTAGLETPNDAKIHAVTAWRLIDKPPVTLDEVDALEQAADGLTVILAVARCPVLLGGPDDEPIVRGKRKPGLSVGQYRVVKALIDAFPGRVDTETLASRSETEYSLGMIWRLRERDQDWEAVLDRPGGGEVLEVLRG